ECRHHMLSRCARQDSAAQERSGVAEVAVRLAPPTAPPGVFDSGLGGLTVVRALRERLPAESIVYLGDTARVPYGTRSRDTVIKYALACSKVLIGRGVKAIVV